MHYPASTSNSSNKGSSSSAWSYRTSSSSASLPRTPAIGIANLPPSPATPGNSLSGGGAHPMAPHMSTVSLPSSEPGTPGYYTGARPFLRVKTRRMLMLDRRSSNTPGELGQRVKADAFWSSTASYPRIQPCTVYILQRNASNAGTCCASRLHQFQHRDT